MTDPRFLIVYYSKPRRMRGFVARLAEYLGADVEEIHVTSTLPGVFGRLSMAIRRLLNLETDFAPLKFDPYLYDVVIIASPVMNASVSAPIRTYLHRRRDRIHNVAFFLTARRVGFDRALWQLVRLAKNRPLATLILREKDWQAGNYGKRAKRFVSSLMQAWSMETLLDPTSELLFRLP